STSYAELKTALRAHFEKYHLYEGPELSLVVNADYFCDVMASEQEIQQKKAKRKLEVVVTLKDGKAQMIDQVDRS
ncbi:MAG: hypothetical protein J6W66_02075, partial [Lachnospiraceae bacterium]|nr:hypothetical protein [Lachnospiraceae bacterium]